MKSRIKVRGDICTTLDAFSLASLVRCISLVVSVETVHYVYILLSQADEKKLVTVIVTCLVDCFQTKNSWKFNECNLDIISFVSPEHLCSLEKGSDALANEENQTDESESQLNDQELKEKLGQVKLLTSIDKIEKRLIKGMFLPPHYHVLIN